tara:strand:+ start:142 stop:600 length:459 start_codon:yes stop_codon:yes gene_type:complete
MNITINNDKVLIKGTINIPYKNAKIIAANPIDKMMNYSGSGQPFPSSEIAFENTPNIYKINEAIFNIEFKYPNSYYMPNGKDKIPPTIYLIADNKIIENYKLPDILPLKTLNYRKSESKEKYYGYKDGHLPIVNSCEKMYAYKQMKFEHNIS